MVTALAAAAVIVVLVVVLGHLLLKKTAEIETARRRQREADRARQRAGRRIAALESTLAAERAEYAQGLDDMAEALDDAETRALEFEGRYLAAAQEHEACAEDIHKLKSRLGTLEKDPHYKYGCTKRGAFRLEEDAQRFADHLAQQEGEAMTVYTCPQCREFFTGNRIFHVAHQTPFSVRAAREVGLDQRNLATLRKKLA